MRIRNALIDALIYALYMLAACLTCMFAEILIIKVLSLLFVIDYFVLCIIRAVIYTLGVNAILCILAYREGYRAAECSVISTLVSGIIAMAIHSLFALLFRFEAFCAGGVRFLAALTEFGPNLTSSAMIGEMHLFDFLPAFFINGAVYCILMAGAKYIGAHRRLADRMELTANRSEAETVSSNNTENDF